MYRTKAEQRTQKKQSRLKYPKLNPTPLMQGNCKNCNDLFYLSRINEAFCTEICFSEYVREMYKNRPSSEETGRFKIFTRDEFKCVYCGMSVNDGIKLTVDHIFPISKKGGNDAFNLVTCCHQCNSHKHGVLMPTERIHKMWKRNVDLDTKSGLINQYEELKREFDVLYRQRMK